MRAVRRCPGAALRESDRLVEQLGLLRGRSTGRSSLTQPGTTPARADTRPELGARAERRNRVDVRTRHDVRMKSRQPWTLTYPDAHRRTRCCAMLADPAFRKAVSVYQHVIDFACRITPETATGRWSCDRAGPRHRPASRRSRQKLVGDEIRFVQHETWDVPDGADVEVTIPGKPGEIARHRSRSSRPAPTSSRPSTSRSGSASRWSAARSRTSSPASSAGSSTPRTRSA